MDAAPSLPVASESREVLNYAKKKQRNAPNVSLCFLLAALFGSAGEGWGGAQKRQAPVGVGGSDSTPQNKSGVLCRLAPL